MSSPHPIVTLLAGAFTALSAGTNYAISSYAPQLAARLGLSVTQLNLVSTSANVGMYLTGSIAGPVIDQRGPRIVLLFSAAILFTGWTLMRAFYDGGQPGIFSTFGVPGVAFAQLLTGVGSSMGNGSAVNGVARSFTVKRRATALSLIFCCTGLSAFVYSTASRLLFHSSPNGTSHFLLLLSLGCATSMLVGATFVRPARYPTGHPGPLAQPDPESLPAADLPAPDEQEPLLATSKSVATRQENIRGWALVATADFWILFTIEGLLAGVGLMYLNNLGTVLNTLWLSNPASGSIPSAQADLVSVFSVLNALGRIFIGGVTDYFSHRAPRKYRVARVWFTVPVSALFVVSLSLAKKTEAVKGLHGLMLPTALTGFAYGCLWGIMPVLCLDWFGLKSYSSNNGLLVLAPAVYGQITNYTFGRVYDSHARVSPSDSAVTIQAMCSKGNECYGGAFNMAVGMASLAMVLSVVAGLRRGRRVEVKTSDDGLQRSTSLDGATL